ncbi:hypothetical protein Pmani_026828 [Petrolisthes manimaculis]|uniref:peptidylprolyl isomerase n=1 Tax=Petrolisthes manimaculis TaxID=1843537 RepID=A0AAE1TX24_9EUCA|nr:hypothetical protein Pmani_026828 [Petrolisthes manimaculis]
MEGESESERRGCQKMEGENEGRDCQKMEGDSDGKGQQEGHDSTYTLLGHLTETVQLSDLCSDTGSGFGVSEEPFETYLSSPSTFFDDDSVISSLQFGAGNCYFNGDENSNSEDEIHIEPFEKLAQKMEDLTGDGGVLKMELWPGVGDDLPSGASVVFHFSAFLQYCDEPFDSSHLRNKPERKLVDMGEMILGLNLAIKTMRKGEIARFLIQSEYAYGKLGCLPRIPGDEAILYEVNLISFLDRAAADSYEELDEQARSSVTFKEKLEAARAYHRQGNENYREHCLPAARKAYHRASWIMENAGLQNEAEEVQRGSILAKLHSNLAQVFLDMMQPERACTQCKLGIRISRGQSDDVLAKIYYRFGKAKAFLNDFKGARKEFQHAQHLKPNNPEINKELAALLEKEMKVAAKERFMCQRMFSSLGNNNNQVASDSKLTPPISSPQVKKDSNDNSEFPNVTPEFERVVGERLLYFAADTNVNELTFPSMLSQEEITFISAAAKIANLSIQLTYKGRDAVLKLVKKKG